MHKRIFRIGPLLVALVALAGPAVVSQQAHAQSAKPVQERFYDMATQEIEGRLAKPAECLIVCQPRLKWDRLSRLTKSMRAPLKASQADLALR